GTYTLTPSKTGVNFNPTSQSVTVSNGPQTVPVFTASVPSGIALIQKATNGNEATGANISVSFPSNNTAGNFLIITGTAARPAGTLTISDTAGDTFVPAFGPVTDTNQDVTAYIWYVPSCKGGPNTVTLTPATAAALEIHISEWTGLTTTSPVDQTTSATGTGTTASSGTATTTVNGELIFGYTFLFNTAAAGSGFTPMSLVNGDLQAGRNSRGHREHCRKHHARYRGHDREPYRAGERHHQHGRIRQLRVQRVAERYLHGDAVGLWLQLRASVAKRARKRHRRQRHQLHGPEVDDRGARHRCQRVEEQHLGLGLHQQPDVLHQGG